ncbi:MAG: hypothetical protein FWF67_07610 [Fibromonadales bacterium]|nr:hypothetical protein [Fibromonadales bacterium]
MENLRSIAIHPKAKELVAAEVKRMRNNGLCASEKMVVANCIYQVLGKQVETK